MKLVTYNCDKCKKSFKKLQDYLEHKDQHLETSSEKSDDKSVKSSLSTKDIIHECSLCYMVFPNEHSLNKHTVICLRKKKQSAAKQAAKQSENKETTDAEEPMTDDTKDEESNKPSDEEYNKPSDEVKIYDTVLLKPETVEIIEKEKTPVIIEKETESTKKVERKNSSTERRPTEKEIKPEKRSNPETEKANTNLDDCETPIKIKKIEQVKNIITISNSPVPKKRTPSKEKSSATVTKRQKSINAPLPVVDEATHLESTDEDEIRYMLNPNFKGEESTESKLFMKVNAKKRNSLQIERPNSKDLMKRRISLQHPPKIPRLKAKAIEARPINSLAVEKKLKMAVAKPLSPIDSDDSDVKYSFPKSEKDEVENVEKKVKKTLADKRKSLSGIAKRKSLGKHKIATPINNIKKRKYCLLFFINFTLYHACKVKQ